MIVYSVTKIFGVDAVKTRVFKKKSDALTDINETINLVVDDNTKVEKIDKGNGEIYFIVNKSKNPEDYIEFVLRENEVK